MILENAQAASSPANFLCIADTRGSRECLHKDSALEAPHQTQRKVPEFTKVLSGAAELMATTNDQQAEAACSAMLSITAGGRHLQLS